MAVRRRKYGSLYAEQKNRQPAIIARISDDDDEPDFPDGVLVLGPDRTAGLTISPSVTGSYGQKQAEQYDTDDSFVTTATVATTVVRTLAPTVTVLKAEQSAAATTVVVEIGPRPPPRKGGLSEGTEHLLIAAGSIGATIIIVLVVYGIFWMRRKNLSFSDVFTRKGRQARRDRYDEAAGLPPSYEDYSSMKSLPVAPQPAALTRQPTNQSQRALMQRSNTGRSEYSGGLRINTANQERSYLEDASPPQQQSSHLRNLSETPSSALLPVQQNGRISPSTESDRRNTRDYDPFTGQPFEATRSPPTFRQFLANRRVSAVPKVSRFSWTTSQAPNTPREPDRQSIGTTRSSVPRFRTIESWVGQQTNRVEDQIYGESSQGQRGTSMFPVPDVPKEYQIEPAAPAPLRIKRNPSRREPEDNASSVYSSPTVNRNTTRSDAPVFHAHPGTEVVIPRGSLVPSEVLNAKVGPPAL